MNGLHGTSKLEFISQDKVNQESDISKYQSLKLKLFHQEWTPNELFDLTTEMLEMNLELYTVWNTRRRALLKLIASQPDLYQKEIHFTTQCLKKHPKSYWVWNHRRWILEHMSDPNWKQELILVSLMLDKDIRNCIIFDFMDFDFF